ncbi:MAG: succinate dehydrogenase cytochrome b subunit [Candidatus Kapabacteria bacterium]|nr:succinate dehydrogenase cytochrome b subunit [Candidatus Kapabacteria bacterium]
MRAFGDVWRSNIFQKWVMALTGLMLVLFLIAHLTGNLLIFMGAEHMNEYGHSLRELLHGSAIWLARGGLLVAFVLHVWSAILLTRRNRAARPQKYVKTDWRTSTMASRSMALSGLLILVYVLYHLAHFTLGTVHSQYYAGQTGWEYTLANGTVVPDVYRMVIASFQEPLITTLYVLSMVLLGLHLNHAVASAFQTLGVTNRRISPLVRFLGPVLGIGVALGFCSLPLAVIAGLVH